MKLRQIWEHFTGFLHAGLASANPVTRRYARTLEAEVLCERAEAVRLHAALERQSAERARHVAEIHRLRAENRALLNSILGIAGVPPITIEAPFPGDVDTLRLGHIETHMPSGFDALLPDDVDALSPRDADASTSPDFAALENSAVVFDHAHATEGAAMDPHFAPLPEKAPSPSAKPESPAPRSPFPISDMLHGSRDLSHSPISSATGPTSNASPNSARPSESAAAGETRVIEGRPEPSPASLWNFTARSSSARARFPRTTSLSPREPRPVTPVRRRSWHQINRLLEIESSRKPVSGE